jgi:hypothetical protein
MKLQLRVTQTDGSVFDVKTNLFVIVAWERKFKRKSSEMGTAIGHEDLLFLAYEAAKGSNVPVPPVFDDFIKRVEDIDVIQEAVGPTDPASTEDN